MITHQQILDSMKQQGYSKEEILLIKKYKWSYSDKILEMVKDKVPIAELEEAIKIEFLPCNPWAFCKFEPDVDY